MAWDNVRAIVKFWNHPTGSTWTTAASHPLAAFQSHEIDAIIGMLEFLYHNSETARQLLEVSAQADILRFGKSINLPAFGVSATFVPGNPTGYVGLNLDLLQEIYLINFNGYFRQSRNELTIVHELHHALYASSDPAAENFIMNLPNYDYFGGPVTMQNQVAWELSWSSYMQAGYHAQVSSEGNPPDPRFVELLSSQSWTDGEFVDVVRLGDLTERNDLLDTSVRGDSDDLIFGFSGDDMITAGEGRDFIYGGSGNDIIFSGDGNDVIIGGINDDFIHCDPGNDIVWGGNRFDNQGSTDGDDTVTYQAAPSAITIAFNGAPSGISLTVSGGHGGTDTLHSIERILGSNHDDRLIVTGSHTSGGTLEFDGGGGHNEVILDSATGAQIIQTGLAAFEITIGSSVLTITNATVRQATQQADVLRIGGQGSVSIELRGGDDRVELVGIGHMIDGGAGFDGLSLLAASKAARVDIRSKSALFRDSGQSTFASVEEVSGSDQADVMYGSGAGTRLVSGGGTNYLEGSGTDVLVGGGGNTYFQLIGGGTASSGAGNDYINVTSTSWADVTFDWDLGVFLVTGTQPGTIIFGRGSGHDVLGSPFGVKLESTEAGVRMVAPGSWMFERSSDTILFQNLARSDVELVWEWQPGPDIAIGDSIRSDAGTTRMGNAVIRIKDSGETLHLGALVGAEWNGRFFLSWGGDGLHVHSSKPLEMAEPWPDSGVPLLPLRLFSFSDGTRYSLSELFDLKTVPSTPLPPHYGEAATLMARLGAESGIVAGSEAADSLGGTAAAEDLFGGGGDDVLADAGGDDFVRGGGGWDLIIGSAGDDDVDGGPEHDTIDYGWTNAGVTVDLMTGVASGPEIGADRLRSVELVIGGSGDDHLIGGSDYAGLQGGAGNDLIQGGAGNDDLAGGEGYDSLHGGPGSDTIEGGTEGDVLDGGAGDDILRGGSGDDVYLVSSAGDAVVESAAEGEDEVQTGLAVYGLPDHVERLTGIGASGQELTGNELGNMIWAGGGGDQISGGDGADELRGNGGNDVIDGGDGDDLIVGGSGIDHLTGGGGADEFRFSPWTSSTGAADTISDFVPGVDRIDLAGVDASFWVAGDQAFTFIGTHAFSGAAGELRYEYDGVATSLTGDTDGDGVADLMIILNGHIDLTAVDLVL